MYLTDLHVWHLKIFRKFKVLDFASYAALPQPISVLHTTTQIEPSGEPSTSCRALIKSERQ
jgi:hypothetical protein